jgi:hypothetical protein
MLGLEDAAAGSWPLRHLVGILMSIALLSLGGPFWFNLLKQLSDLRPALADEVDKDPKQLAPTVKNRVGQRQRPPRRWKRWFTNRASHLPAEMWG